MQPDFRREFYERPGPAGAGGSAPLEGRARRAFHAWCRSKFLPLFRDLPPGAAILDLGCGSGAFMEFLGACGFAGVEGVDVSESRVREAAARGLRASQADAFEFLEPVRGRFDAVVALDLLEHFAREEALRLLGLVLQALKPGGRLVLQTPNGQGLFARPVALGDLTHLTVYTPASLEQALRARGFEAVEFREAGPAPKNLAGIARLGLWSLLKLGVRLALLVETGASQSDLHRGIWTQNLICRAWKAGRPGETQGTPSDAKGG
ncbi:MAG: class I SAM-dependent methyltransferase [Planctomycetes bacterium]|nr:class I SAM-dependent methyltransferase [Planctomycetota bacterium]